MSYKLKKSVELAFALFDPNYEMRVQVFSFGFYKNRLLAVGRNTIKGHSWNLRNPLIKGGKHIYKVSSCAESNLFLRLKNLTSISYDKIDVVNLRLDRERKIKNSCPCSSCFNLLSVIKPRSLVYSNDLGEFEKFNT